jgi:hypothetical protein
LNIEYTKSIPILKECDILVIGGSQSGVAAAVTAKRTNPDARVILIEQFGYLGGQSVGVMVCHYEFREYTNNKGQIIAKGIGKEMIQRIVAKGHSDPLYSEWLAEQGPPFKNVKDGRAFGDIPLEVEDIKLAFQEMCDEAGVEVILFAKFVDLKTQRNIRGVIKPEYVIMATMEGLKAIKAKILIDCTANNDVAYQIGPEHVESPQHKKMPMQVYAWLGGVDIEKFIHAFWEHRNWWTFAYPDDKDQMLAHMREGKTMVIRGGAEYLDQVEEKYPGILEQLGQFCDPIIYYWIKPVRIFSYKCEKTTKYTSWWAIEGPVSFADQTNALEVSKFMQTQLRAVHIMQKIHSILPGWENCFVVRTSDRMGFRQTRMIKGIYALTENDVKEAHIQPDVIGRGSGHDISRFHSQFEYGYDIPYRCLVPTNIDGLLVGARSISCEDKDPNSVALNAHRGISATIIVSQAAGTAAGLCIKHNIEPRDIDMKELQENLRKQNVVLDPPEEKE